jgi:pyruvate,water dikinase
MTVKEKHKKERFILFFDEIGIKDIPYVGGKTASLGEMKGMGLPVPDGFAVTAHAYRYFIEKTGIKDELRKLLLTINTNDFKKLHKLGSKIRKLITKAKMPKELEEEIMNAYLRLRGKDKQLFVAVRSSATAEDLPDASFAGQQESFLNVAQKDLIKKVKQCFASLFTDRAISYRTDKGFDHFSIYISVAVQKLIFSKVSGVMFTLEPDSGHPGFIFINGSWGLGDYIVQGVVQPDQFLVFKGTKTVIQKKLGTKKLMEIRSRRGVKKKKVPEKMRNRFILTDEEAMELAEYGIMVESHYKRPMDIEWAKDEDGFHIIQARPETVHSVKDMNVLNVYRLKEKSKILLYGEAIGRKIATGKVNIIKSVKKMGDFRPGQILVTKTTDPDWEPIMKIAAGIITEEGGKTSHAAIVSRELGLPCIIGAKDATKILENGQMITIDCTTERGNIWKGELKFEVKKHRLKKIPKTRTKVFVNLGVPENALDVSQMPIDGVGLARQEFIITSSINEHPLFMIASGRSEEFQNKLAEGFGKIGAAFYPRPVIVRFSDFKTNEYRNLPGGDKYEPEEENPMIGWRGASRYISPEYEPAFRLECRAIRDVREKMKLKNVHVMVPFCRTIDEAKKVLKIMEQEGLSRGKNFQVYIMAEVPSNVLMADEFARYFDGFSIGSNDLTQLTLGIDRDSALLAGEFDERNPAVKRMIKKLIKDAHKRKRKVSICGQAPSEYPEFVDFLVENKIDSISVNPDVAIETKLLVARAEKKRKKK